MKKVRQPKPLLIFFLLVLSLALSLTGLHSLSAATGENLPNSIHNLKINLTPEKHWLEVDDHITKPISEEERSRKELSFELNENLKINSIVDAQTLKPVDWYLEKTGKGKAKLHLLLPDETGDGNLSTWQILIKYSGVIYDPVRKSSDLSFVRGDATTGLIGAEGTFLSYNSFWIPTEPGRMALYNLQIRIPEPFKVVTQGRLVSREAKEGLDYTVWTAEAPSNELTLVAGKYAIASQVREGILISTYFSQENQDKSHLFIQAASDYLKFYISLLGPYPYSRFDIVENFFSTGYGCPAFTLLGPEVIKMGERASQPGYLDHEIVHSWWGNYVYYEPEAGNWAEGITSYLTNYLYKEKKKSPQEARKHRRDISLKYAIRVRGEKDYPVGQFRGKEEDYENDIGYGKASMIFHQVRELLGGDKFFQGLRDIIQEFGGKTATWRDFRKSFEALYGRNLEYFFNQWLNYPGGPKLELTQIDLEVMPEGYLIKGAIRQWPTYYRIAPLSLGVDTGKDNKDTIKHTVDLEGEKTSFIIATRELPVTLELDPDSHLFRQLWPEEIVPCLNAVLGFNLSYRPNLSLCLPINTFYLFCPTLSSKEELTYFSEKLLFCLLGMVAICHLSTSTGFLHSREKLWNRLGGLALRE